MLSPKSPPTVDAGQLPIDLAVSPDGKSVYVVNCCVPYDVNSFSISQYDVGPNGKLLPKSPPTVAAGTLPSAIAVSPDGKSAYVTNRGSGSGGRDRVLEYDVGPNGALVLRGPPRAATGKYPGDVAVSPDGESVYVANGGNPPPIWQRLPI